jgi:cell division septation protein DedD
MVLSESLHNIDRMVQIALALKDIDLDKVVFIQYPTGASGNGVKPITDAADALTAALKADQPVVLSGGTAPGDIGSVVQTPAPTPVAPSTPGVVATPTPAASATAAPTVLPDAVTGQTAAQNTCSKGRTLNNQ